MTNIDVYAAGLIDGEGCIYVQDTARKGQKVYSPVVEIGMSEKALPVLKVMQHHYQGSISQHREATERWSAAYHWRVNGAKAAECLRRLQPHLILKSEQARLAIRTDDIRSALIPPGATYARWTEEAADRCAVIRRRIQELNAKGPESPAIAEMEKIYGPPTARLVAGQWVTDQADLLSDLGWEPYSGPWSTSGFACPGAFWMRNTSEFPSVVVASSLSDILESPGPHLRKFFLSAKAAQGILRRAAKRGRVLPAQLQAALESLAGSGGGLVPTVSSKWSKGTGGPSGDECQNLVLDDTHTHTHTVSTLQARYYDNQAQAGHLIAQPSTVIGGGLVHSLTSEGHDASEDGTGRGTPIITYSPDVASTLSSGQSSPGVSAPGRRQEDDHNIVAEQWWGAFHMTQDPISSETHTPCLGANAQVGVLYSIMPMNSGTDYKARAVEVAQPLMTTPTGGNQGGDYIVQPLAIRGREGGAELEAGEPGAPYNALRAGDGDGDGGSSRQSLIAVNRHAETIVRRLTPTECERLQGYPDGWTAYVLKDVLATIITSWDALYALWPNVAEQLQHMESASCITSESNGTELSIFRNVTNGNLTNASRVTGWLGLTEQGDGAVAITNHGSGTATRSNRNVKPQSETQKPSVSPRSTAALPRLQLAGTCDEEKSSTISTLIRAMTSLETCSSATTTLNTSKFTVHWNVQPPPYSALDSFTLRMASTKSANDSARYRQLGNSVAVPCVEWIARRLIAVHDRIEEVPF